MRRRRDPRAERQGRRVPGAERPRFALVVMAPAPVEGGRRRDPRARRDAARVMVGTRPRIDWRARPGSSGRPAAAMDGTASVRPEAARIIAEPAFLVVAVLDQPGGAPSVHDRQLIAASRDLAGDDGAVVALAACASDGLGAAGADRVMALAAEASGHAEARVAGILAAIEALKPRHVLFAENAEGGGEIARRVAARLGERLLTGVETIADGRAARRMGGAMEMRTAVPRLMSIAEGAFVVHEGARHEARPLDTPAVAPAAPRVRISPLQVDPDRIPIAESDFLLSAGNGVTDWASFAELGAVLGATRAGSRVVCDDGHLPRDRQVGASGTVVTARCYLAFGISGAPQHLQGITEVGHVVAINTDLHAEMIKRADLAIVADAQEVMPALIAHARQHGAAGQGSGASVNGDPLADQNSRRGRRRDDLQIAVLLSTGRHPASGRARRSPLDARALEAALALADETGGYVHGIHVGDPDEPALRDYLGMGLKRLTVLDKRPAAHAPTTAINPLPRGEGWVRGSDLSIGQQHPSPHPLPVGEGFTAPLVAGSERSHQKDVVPALVSYLRALRPDIVLAGGRGEGGEESGMVPYLVAEALGMPVVPEVAGLSLDGDGARLIQALPRGRRQLVEARLPLVASVNAAARPARQVAFAKARRGVVDVVPAEAAADIILATAERRPWRPRPKRLAVAPGGSAADRLRAMTETKAGAGAVLIRPAPEEAARAVYDYLVEKGLA
jgi:electron transfer flavoprotein alpha subunit